MAEKLGAGEGNRTLVVSLGSFCSTIELHPRAALRGFPIDGSGADFKRIRGGGSGLSGRQPPARADRQQQRLQHRDGVETGAERLLAGLVPERRAARIGAGGAAEQGQAQQRILAQAPPAAPGAGLVDAEGGEGGKVDRHQCQRQDRGHAGWPSRASQTAFTSACSAATCSAAAARSSTVIS